MAKTQWALKPPVVDRVTGGAENTACNRTPRPHQNMRADGVEVLGIALDKRRALVQIGLALHLHAGAPVVVFHGRIRSDANFHDARKLV